MKKLNDAETLKTSGGSVAGGIAIFTGVCTVVSFLISVLYGYINPRKCE